MRVLGVDPGLTRCGVGVVDANAARRLSLVEVAVLRTPADLDHAVRLLRIEQGLDEFVCKYRPDVVSVERVFAQHNRSTVTGTTQVAGIAMLVAARHGIPAVTHTPSEVKLAVTGSGSANKSQVGNMVARLLNMDEIPGPPDAADALALAITHLWRGGATNRYAAAVAAHRRKS